MSAADCRNSNEQPNAHPGQLTRKTAAAYWDEQMLAWQEGQARTGRQQHPDWEMEEAARRYWEMVWRYQPERLEYLLSRLHPVAGKRILDIGSGPGVLAIPLAEAGAAVTAVEPSPAMLKVLKEMAARRKSPEIECLCRRWEELDPDRDLKLNQPFDIVIASLSLLMVGIRHCLLKMKRVCSPGGQIFLLWPSSQNHWTKELKILFPKLYGLDYVPKPDAELLLRVIKEVQAELVAGIEERRMAAHTEPSTYLSRHSGGPDVKAGSKINLNPSTTIKRDWFGAELGRHLKIKDKATGQHRIREKFFKSEGSEIESPINSDREVSEEVSAEASSGQNHPEEYKISRQPGGTQESVPSDEWLQLSPPNRALQKVLSVFPGSVFQECEPNRGFISCGPGYPASPRPGDQLLAIGPAGSLSDLPSIATEKMEFIYRESFSSEAEALAHFQAYFGVDPDDQRRTAILREFLKRNLTYHDQDLMLEHPLPTLLIRW